MLKSILFFILLPPSLGFAQWTPNLNSLEGKLQFVQSLTERHPRITSANLQYRRNMIQVLDPVSKLLESLGVNAADVSIQSSEIEGLEFWSGGDKYDDEKLGKLRSIFKNNLEKIELKKFTNFSSDIRELKRISEQEGSLGQQKTFERNVKLLVALAPLIYQSDGNAVTEANVNDRIETTSPNQLSNLYEDLLPKHLYKFAEETSKTSGMGQVSKLFQNVLTNFVKITVIPATIPVAEEGRNAQRRFIGIEKMSPLVGLFRGAAGGDCSILSVPYYPLVKDVEIFWIRKDRSAEADPAGYAFVVPVTRNGQTVPYIMTINGSTLSDGDTKAVIQLVADRYHTSSVLLPNTNVNPHVVNYEAVKKGLKFDSAEYVSVDLPPGWKIIEKYLDENKSGYTNYYHSTKIGSAILVNTESKPINSISRSKSAAFFPYKESSNVESLPLLERALLANQVLASGVSRQLKMESVAN